MCDRSFMDGVGYVVFNSQWELFDKIIANIEANNKSQTILAPNGGGKTSMSLLLALKLSKDGHTVLHYTGDRYGLDYKYVCEFMCVSKDLFKGVDFAGFQSIHRYSNRSYEFIIIDSGHSVIDSYSLSNKKNFDDSIVRVNRAIQNEAKLSSGEFSILALNCLGSMIRRDSSYVINFEPSHTPEIGYTPVLASENILTATMTQDEFNAYSENVYQELDKISIIKKEYALQGKMTPVKARNYDSMQEEILDKLEQIRQEVRGEFGTLEKKVDSLQEDIQFMKQNMRELESSVHDRKNLLELYFSTNSNDEKSTELFITKVLTLITDEISAKMDTLSNSQTYRVAEKLVKMKMGEKALSKMGPESLKFLVTAKYLFNQNMNLGEEIDYSSVCLLASKAFEVELSKRFVIGYQNYLRNRRIRIEQWPPAMKKTVRSNFEAESVPLTVEDFTLGNCSYIMGIWGKRTEREENKNCFKSYCMNVLMKGLSSREIDNKCNEFDGYIKHVKDHYRNPAAHKNAIGLEEANNCLDYIVEVERIMRIMLEVFEV